MRVIFRAVLVMAVALSIALPAQADHGGIHPTLRTEQAFFHCAGPIKAQNAYVAQGTIPSWDTTAPAESVEAGAGCGFYDNLVLGVQGQYPLAAVWEGTFAGNLDALTVELHRLLPAAGATFPNRITVIVTIDGAQAVNAPVDVVHSPSSTGASTVAKFSLRNLNLKTEDGDGTQERTVRVTVSSFNETQAIWVFDTTEVPAGITFNPSTLEGTVVN